MEQLTIDKASKVAAPVILNPTPGREDDCSLCVHEHENWGNNIHCRDCDKRYKG